MLKPCLDRLQQGLFYTARYRYTVVTLADCMSALRICILGSICGLFVSAYYGHYPNRVLTLGTGILPNQVMELHLSFAQPYIQTSIPGIFEHNPGPE